VSADSYVVETSTTMGLAPRERADFWSDHVRSYQGGLDFRFPDAGDFHGGTTRQRTRAYQLVEFWSDPVAYLRTPLQIRRHSDGNYRLVLPLDGRLTIRLEGAQERLAMGAGSLADPGVPLELRHDGPARGLVLSIPDLLGGPPPRSARLNLGSGLGRVVNAMVVGLAQRRDEFTGSQFNAVCDRVVELLGMLALGDNRPDAPGSLAEVEALARRYVAEHVTDPELNVATMARALGWSVRQVQLALQRRGTTARELIRDERLRVVRKRLLSPAYRNSTITEVAYASGYTSAGALNAAFRRRFGVSPRELRRGDGLTTDETTRSVSAPAE